MWESYKKGFKAYLQLEKSLSDNSVEAYLRDVDKLNEYLLATNNQKKIAEIELKDLQKFVKWVAELGMTSTSQARIISGIRAFYKYCLIEQIIIINPSVLLEAPKTKRTLPDILSYDEIENMIAQIDLSTTSGGRDKAIIETMYSCGLSVCGEIIFVIPAFAASFFIVLKIQIRLNPSPLLFINKISSKLGFILSKLLISFL